MIPAASMLQHWLRSAYASRRQVILFLDYDGTLVPLAPHPDQAILHDSTRDLLADLARLPQVFVGIISGRTLDDVQAKVRLDSLFYAGISGLEIDLGSLRLRHHSAMQVAPVMGRLIEHVESILADFPGSWIENKQFGMTVHFRNLVADRQRELQARVAGTIQALSASLRIATGPSALEIGPSGQCHKGTAVQAIIDHLGNCSPACLCAGDEANDVEMFEAVTAQSGICLGVGTSAPYSAHVRLASPIELNRVLRGMRNDLAQIAGRAVG